MKPVILAIGAAAVAAISPASAQVMKSQVFSISGSIAEDCFVAADGRDRSYHSLLTCNRAFDDEQLSRQNEFATLVNRGIVRTIRQDFEGAQADFDRAIAMDANRPEVWLNKGIMHYYRGEAAAAVESFDRALELGTSKAAIAYYGRGLSNEDSGNLKAAYADLQHARELAPNWPDPARELARYQVVRR